MKNNDGTDDSGADTNSEGNDSLYERLTDTRGILDSSSDSWDSVDGTDANGDPEDGGTTNPDDDTVPVQNNDETWLHKCLDELFPIGAAGLAKAHMACAVSVTDGSDPTRVPLVSREFVAEEYLGRQAVFVPCGFSPAFGTFSAIKAPQCLAATVDGIIRDSRRKNGNFEWVTRKQTVEGLLRSAGQATAGKSILEERRKWVAAVAKDDGPLTGLTFGVTVNIVRMMRRNRNIEFVISNVLSALAEGVQNLGGTSLGLYGFAKAVRSTGMNFARSWVVGADNNY
ncbi:hypothetical protein V1506DRAFT_465844 [Lipomyces tetrasporus]